MRTEPPAPAGRALALAFALAALAACGRSNEAPPPPAANATVNASEEEPPLPRDAANLQAELPPPYNQADLQNGQLHFELCRSCHTAVKGGPDMTGPNLHGVFGRKVASEPGFAYSDALKAKTWTWDVAHLDGWLKDPKSYVPGTKMSFYGLRNDRDRMDTIAYLKVVSSSAE